MAELKPPGGHGTFTEFCLHALRVLFGNSYEVELNRAEAEQAELLKKAWKHDEGTTTSLREGRNPIPMMLIRKDQLDAITADAKNWRAMDPGFTRLAEAHIAENADHANAGQMRSNMMRVANNALAGRPLGE